MDDKFQILKNMAREYNPEDKSLTKKAIELANDYSKVCKSNFKLQQEIQQLKDRIAYLERSISRKEETIVELNNELVETPKEVELENRIAKAIECMNNTFNITSVKDMINIMNKIEEILKGEL